MKKVRNGFIKNLRYICLISVIVFGLMTIVGTGGGNGGATGGNGGATNTVTIKGNILNGSHAKNLWYDRLLDKIHSPAHALDPNEVAKVMIFYQDGSHKFSKVTEDGNFSIQVDKSAPAGMIFVGAGDNFLGYLTLGDGIDTLPLNSIADDVSEIDLGVLSSLGLIVEPSHNPLGNEIPLTPEEQKALAQCDDLFSSIVKNPDVDGNGIIDFLEGKFFGLQILYYVNEGSFDGNLSPTVNEPADITGYRLAFDATDAYRPDNVDFTGPPGSGLLNSTSTQSNVYPDRTTYFSHYIHNPSIPPAGQYTVDYKASTLTFTLPDQSAAPSNIVLPVPTVTLNDDRTIQKVNWVYRLGSGATAALDPLTIISKIELQIDGSGSPCGSYPQQGRIYNSGWLSATTTGHVLTCQTLYWDDITRIYMAYEDLYGNHYVVICSKGEIPDFPRPSLYNILTEKKKNVIDNIIKLFTYNGMKFNDWVNSSKTLEDLIEHVTGRTRTDLDDEVPYGVNVQKDNEGNQLTKQIRRDLIKERLNHEVTFDEKAGLIYQYMSNVEQDYPNHPWIEQCAIFVKYIWYMSNVIQLGTNVTSAPGGSGANNTEDAWRNALIGDTLYGPGERHDLLVYDIIYNENRERVAVVVLDANWSSPLDGQIKMASIDAEGYEVDTSNIETNTDYDFSMYDCIGSRHSNTYIWTGLYKLE